MWVFIYAVSKRYSTGSDGVSVRKGHREFQVRPGIRAPFLPQCRNVVLVPKAHGLEGIFDVLRVGEVQRAFARFQVFSPTENQGGLPINHILSFNLG